MPYSPDKRQAKWQQAARRRYKALQDFMREQKRGKDCERCGFDDPRTFHFHHRDPKQKRFTISKVKQLTPRWKERILSEIAKCDVLCANCHAIEHRQL